MNTQGNIEEIEAREEAATHRHRFEQKYERSIPSCTVKVWECPCGVWQIRHFGCFNANHDPDSLATATALLAQLKDREEKLVAVEEYAHTLAEATRAALECVNPDDEGGLRAFALAVADAQRDRILQGGE